MWFNVEVGGFGMINKSSASAQPSLFRRDDPTSHPLTIMDDEGGDPRPFRLDYYCSYYNEI